MKPSRAMALLSGVAAVALFAGPASAAKFELKLAHFVTPKHSYSQWLARWANEVEKKSNGAIHFTIFPNNQMGPPPVYYDLARKGRADVTWFNHGFTPGRFPLTEISHLPFLIGSAEIGAKVLNTEALKEKYLDPEHKGVKLLQLMTHQPGNLHTAKKPVRTVEDMKGLRIRAASRTISDFIRVLGGTPRGLPPTQIVEQMQKGTLDGCFIDYGGAGIAFRMGPVTKYTTEMYSYVSSFGVAMNLKTYSSLPTNLQKLVVDTMKHREKEVGHEWDKLDAIGKAIMVKAGDTPIVLPKKEMDRFRAAGAKVTEMHLAALEKRGLPARKVYKMMKDLAAKYAKTSKVFWRD
jgi:TRAP-type C4-dicarboxylate transport system substrate-binding protein